MEDIEKVAGEVAPEQTARSSYETQALSRRQALGRIGFLAGASAIAALGADDLTRIVGKEMQRIASDNDIARSVAKEFSNAGVAFASPSIPVSTCFLSKDCVLPCYASAGYSCESCTGWCYNYLYLVARNCGALSAANCQVCCEDQLSKCTAAGSACQLAYLDCVATCTNY